VEGVVVVAIEKGLDIQNREIRMIFKRMVRRRI